MTSKKREQKFHTGDSNQCLHNKSGSHGVPNVNLFDFMFLPKFNTFSLMFEGTVSFQSGNFNVRGVEWVGIFRARMEVHTFFAPDGWLYFALRRSNKGTGVEMCPAIVSGIVPRDTLVSYWPIVFLVTSNSPRRLWESYLGPVSSSIVQS